MGRHQGVIRTSRPEKSGVKFRTVVLCAAMASAFGMPLAHADAIGKLQSEINDLSAQLNQLKAAQAVARKTAASQPAPASPSAQYVTKGTMPGSYLVPGTNTSVYVGGFINFQGIYSDTENLGPKFQIGNLTPSGSASQQQSARTFHFQDKVSRLIVGTSTPTPLGPATTNFGFDFYGYTPGGDNGQALGNNNHDARVVTAYGTLDGFLVGHTSSNFVDGTDQADTLDNSGPAGVPGGNNPQIRYTMPLHAGGALSFSVENPQTGYQDTQGNIEVGTKTNPLPDLTMKYERSGDWGHFQVSAVARELGFTDMNGVRTTKTAAAGLIGATFNIPDGSGGYGRDYVGFQTWTGAMGRYIPDDFGANVASVLAVNNGTAANPTGATAVEIQPDTGATLYAEHYWTGTLRSAIGLGYNHQKLASFLPADTQNAVTTKTVHVNLVMNPVPSVQIGIEAMWGQKTFQASTGVPPASAKAVEVGGIWHF